MRHGLAAILAVLMAVPGEDLARGVQQTEAGEYAAAILTLDAVVRGMAAERPVPTADLARAYLYLGLAHFEVGHETTARARFRDAVRHVPDIEFPPGRFSRGARKAFEEARAERSPTPTRTGGGGSKLPLVIGGLVLAGGAVALASIRSDESGPPGDGDIAYPNEVLAPGAQRPYIVTPTATGTLTAQLTWQQAGVVLSLSIAALSNTAQVLAIGTPTSTTDLQLTLPVTPQGYRLTVSHDAGRGQPVTATYTLRIRHP